jgi:chromate reductase
MPLLALSGSSSSRSINALLLRHAMDLATTPVEYVSVRDIDAPVYSIDLEEAGVMPPDIVALHRRILASDGLIMSVPEHNGGPPAMLKNVLDWLSRVEKGSQWLAVPTLFVGTSPGGRGAITALTSIAQKSPYWGTDVVGVFSLGHFERAFDSEAGALVDPQESERLCALVADLENRRADTIG